MKPLASRWADFDQRCVPVLASDIQREQFKCAFYAGAASALAILAELAAREQANLSAPALSCLIDECNAFADTVPGGRS